MTTFRASKPFSALTDSPSKHTEPKTTRSSIGIMRSNFVNPRGQPRTLSSLKTDKEFTIKLALKHPYVMDCPRVQFGVKVGGKFVFALVCHQHDYHQNRCLEFVVLGPESSIATQAIFRPMRFTKIITSKLISLSSPSSLCILNNQHPMISRWMKLRRTRSASLTLEKSLSLLIDKNAEYRILDHTTTRLLVWNPLPRFMRRP